MQRYRLTLTLALRRWRTFALSRRFRRTSGEENQRPRWALVRRGARMGVPTRRLAWRGHGSRWGEDWKHLCCRGSLGNRSPACSSWPARFYFRVVERVMVACSDAHDVDVDRRWPKQNEQRADGKIGIGIGWHRSRGVERGTSPPLLVLPPALADLLASLLHPRCRSLSPLPPVTHAPSEAHRRGASVRHQRSPPLSSYSQESDS